ncbi:hypothetical protein [Nocardiopsis sp. NPDC006938]|uniref:hypothetical protein n=1 Tax=Nocardiopsis sp. NPDC006938 TaxID=3364337 RepID=UPI0036BB2DC9
MRLFALEGEREVLVTEHYVYAEDGRDLTGDELDVLATQLDRVRLTTKWRELNRDVPLGAYVRATRDAFEGNGRVVGFCKAKPLASHHEITVAVTPTLLVHVGPGDVEVVPEPKGAA